MHCVCWLTKIFSDKMLMHVKKDSKLVSGSQKYLLAGQFVCIGHKSENFNEIF